MSIQRNILKMEKIYLLILKSCPFQLIKKKNYTNTDTFNKMKIINSNVQSLSIYDKELLLAYLKAKKKCSYPNSNYTWNYSNFWSHYLLISKIL